MFVRLLRWELRSTARKILLAFLIYASLCIALPWVLFRFNRDVAAVYSMFALSLGMSAFEIVVLVMLFQRYHTSVYGSEGYLMFTLPTGLGRVLGAKLLAAVLWMAAVSALMAAGMATAFYIIHVSSGGQLFPPFLFRAGGILPALTAVLLSSVSTLTIIYFSVTVSKLAVWRRCGSAAGILIFLGIYIGQTVLSLLSQGGMGAVLRTSRTAQTSAVMDLSAYYTWHSLWGTLLLQTAVSVVLFGATAWLLGHRTELK